MKLHELVINILKDDIIPFMNPMEIRNGQFRINSDKLKEYKNVILSCDEFSDIDELIIVDEVVVKDSLYEPYALPSSFIEVDGEETSLVSRFITDNSKFIGKYYINSITLSPQLYTIEDTIKPVKDGVVIGPTMYDALTFRPLKKLVIEYCPEMEQLQDMEAMGQKIADWRQNLHDLLDKIIDNSSDYEAKGYRRMMINGYGECIAPENDPCKHQIRI